MLDLRKLFVREARARKGGTNEADSDYHPSKGQGSGLEVEYQTLIAGQFRRWGIHSSSVSIEVRLIGRAPDGFDVFVGMVRLDKWERISALRVLLGLPRLESKVRKAVRATWMADFSHFGGLWLHTSEQVHAAEGAGELRDLLATLAPHAPRPGLSGTPGVAEPAPAYGNSSLPPHRTATHSSAIPVSVGD